MTCSRTSKMLLCTLLTAFTLATLTEAANFDVQNHCAYAVWAAAIPYGGGKRLDPQQTWQVEVNPGGNYPVNIWARTKCTFDGSGKGDCETGGCGQLDCQGGGGMPPYTLAEFHVNTQMDYFDINLVNGFNVPMGISPVSNGCNRGVRCAANINDECPKGLKTPGGCKYDPSSAKFFEDRCPDAFTSPNENPTGTPFTCPGGTKYKVVFCP